jgi:hypothetical protein
MGIIEAAKDAGYRVTTVKTLFDEPDISGPLVVIRHDVDRRPGNALAMAHAELEAGVLTSYYFRSVPVSFDESIIRQIAEMGHEVGYHYEDWHLAGFDVQKARASLAGNLERLRALADISTMCMHGSPLSSQNNMTIWDHIDYADYNVKDAVLDLDWAPYVYFGDTGRTFHSGGATNLRDYLGDASHADDVRTSADVMAFLGERRSEHVHISTHPERWSDNTILWATQWSRDVAANTVKRMLKLVRG